MKFSLRTILIVSVVVGAIAGFLILDYQARTPVSIELAHPVSKPRSDGSSTTTTISESSSWILAMQRSNETYVPAEYRGHWEGLLESGAGYDFQPKDEWCRDGLEYFREEWMDAVRVLKTGGLDDQLAAAYLSEEAGAASTYTDVRDAFVASYSTVEQGEFLQALIACGWCSRISDDQDAIDVVSKLLDVPNTRGVAARALCYSGVDERPFAEQIMASYSADKKQPASSMRFAILDSRLSDLIKADLVSVVAANFPQESDGNSGDYAVRQLYRVVGAALSLKSDCEAVEQSQRELEQEVRRAIESYDGKFNLVPHGHAIDCWQVLSSQGTEASLDFCRNALDSESGRGLPSAASMLIRLGFEDEVIDRIDSCPLDEPRAIEFARVYSKLFEPEEQKRRWFELIRYNTDNPAVSRLAAINLASSFQGTSDPDVIELVRNKLPEISNVSIAETILALRRLGDPQILSFIEALPLGQVEGDPVILHYHFRYSNGLTGEHVRESIGDIWDIEPPTIASEIFEQESGTEARHTLRTTLDVLEHAGVLFKFEDTGFVDDNLFNLVESLPDEFGFQSMDVINGGVQLVVRNRTYHIRNSLDHEYGEFEVCNTIAARQGCEKRIFAFAHSKRDGPVYFCFETPETVFKIRDQLGLQLVDGFEYYLDH
ncbi:MAG: hypothetical protein AAF456_14985 [Planctomycetota bacterium]